MQKRSLETCFEDFRSRGDTGALGWVFDQTAAELLRVARHLTHGASEAEDLLQATFLTAIERAPAYDGERPLRPWLLGILVKHASHARRRGGRFSIAGLKPGSYTVTWGWGEGGSLPLAFTLPPEGSTSLKFDFQAAP